MNIGSEPWLDLIVKGAEQLGIAVARSQASAFAVHAQELIQWNQRTNLTAILEPRAVAIKHYLDAIAPLVHIPPHGELIDMGTGGGFPGIPLKILRPDQPMTLIDGVRKKISFVKHVIRCLALENIQAVHGRAEDLAGLDGYQQRFGTIVCRAVADPANIVRMAAGLLAPGGKIIVYQGPDRNPANHAAEEYRQALGGQAESIDYLLPFENIRRRLLVLHF